jgi:hypothetical protein
VIARGARIGLGASVSSDACDFAPGTVRMVIHRNGYVGIVHTPGDEVTVAAAVDAGTLHGAHPGEVITGLLSDAGLTASLQRALWNAEWRGTGPLTRTCRCVARDDILVLGDASGYVEPFTGEGMAWAMHLAVASAEIVSRSLHRRMAAPRGREMDTLGTESVAAAALAAEWNATHRALLYARRRRCRTIASLLRHPLAVRSALRVLQAIPGLATPIIHKVFAANM